MVAIISHLTGLKDLFQLLWVLKKVKLWSMQLSEVWYVNSFQKDWLYNDHEKQWLEMIFIETIGQNVKEIASLL